MQLILVLSLATLVVSSILQPQTPNFQQYMKDLNIQAENYFGCSVWKSSLCQQYSDWFDVNKDQECTLNEEYAKAGCKLYLNIGVCIQCQENWMIWTMIIENMKESSLYCIPDIKKVKLKEENGCLKCREGYEEKNSICFKKEEEEMMTDLGCIIMKEGRCKMCWPAFKKNMEGRCVKM